jgi:hypothetical protein
MGRKEIIGLAAKTRPSRLGVLTRGKESASWKHQHFGLVQMMAREKMFVYRRRRRVWALLVSETPLVLSLYTCTGP